MKDKPSFCPGDEFVIPMEDGRRAVAQIVWMGTDSADREFKTSSHLSSGQWGGLRQLITNRTGPSRNTGASSRSSSSPSKSC